MRKIILFTLVLCQTLSSFSQFPNWRLSFGENGTGLSYPKLGPIKENDKSILMAKGNILHEISYYGEPISAKVFDLPANTIGSINTISKRNINDADVYLLSVLSGDNLIFYTYTLDGEIILGSLEIEEVSYTSGVYAKLDVFEKENGEFLIFGKNAFYTVRLNSDFTWELINEIAHSFEGINSAKKAENSYIITTSSGTAALLSANLTTLWTVETSLPLTIGSKISGGYMLGGHNLGERIAYVAKLSSSGDITAQFAYENKLIFDLIPWGNDVLLVGNTVFTINTDGNILWEKQLAHGSPYIYQAQKSQFGHVLMMGGKKIHSLNINSNEPYNNYESLAANNVGKHVLFTNTFNSNDLVSINYPVNEKKTTIHKDVPIFAAQTESGTFKGFYDLYNMGDDVTGILSDMPFAWKIYQSEIDIIQQKIAAGTDLAPYSQSLLTYPAKGNPNCVINGESITIENNLAPFVDVNEDGIYNMFDGDYPEMKGDQMVWAGVKHTNSGMEVHAKWYAYQCGDHVISNTIYVDYKLINTSLDNLPICHFGNFTDFSLGCPNDNFVGSIPAAHSIFAYNADGYDGNISGGGPSGCNYSLSGSYETAIPVQSVTFLNNEMASAMYFSYLTSGNIDPPSLAPVNFEEVSNYLQAIFTDGTPLTEGGTGYNPESTEFTKFVFPGNPSITDEWSMGNEPMPLFFKSMIAGTHTFSLNTGASKTFTFAYTTHPDIPHPNPEITPVVENIQKMTAIYDNGNAFATVFLGQDQSIAPGESIILNAGDDGLDYAWSTNEDGMTIQVTEPGTYSVTLTDETGCQRSDEITITTLTGLSSVEVTKLAVYPNPAKSGGVISIELPNMEDIAMVKLFNIIGQELYSEQRNEKTQQVDIKLSNTFSAGVYMVQLTNIDGKVMVGKVLIE